MRRNEHNELLYSADVLADFAQSIVKKIGTECFDRYFHENDIHIRCRVVTDNNESKYTLPVNENIHILRVIDGAGTLMEDNCYEININAGIFQDGVDQIVINIIDAMCFIYDSEGQINGGGTSVSRRYKNKRYKAVMENTGCICYGNDSRYGWQNYGAGEVLNERIHRLKIDNDYNSIKSNICYRIAVTTVQDDDLMTKIKPKNSNSKLLECPICHMKLRATKTGLRVMCVLDGIELEYM